MSVETASAVVWGDTVVEATYAGHPGLVYEPRPRSLVALLDESARFGERTFLVQGEQRVTFAQFRRAAVAASGVLQGHGVEPGDRVLIWAYNSPAWVLAMWACWVAGAVPVLGNRWWSGDELAAAVEEAGCTTMITDAADIGRVDVVSVPMSSIAACLDATVDAPGEALDAAEIPDEDAEAMVLFTSGSSGQAKGVRLSHRSVIANQHNLLLRARRLPHQQRPDDPQTVTLVTVPLFHIGGVTGIVTQVVAGGRLVFLHGRFDPAEVLELIEREGVTSWGGVPTMAKRVLDHPDFERRDLSSLRSFPLGGAPVPDVLLDRLREKLPHVSGGLAKTYGLSESGGFLTLARAGDLADRPGTTGRPYPIVEIRIADPDDTGAGEILVRSPMVMLGYLGVDDGTVDTGGWLHTGDVGRFEDGHLFVTGRSKDVVIRGGENVACPHVEAELMRHPDVLEAAVLGIPHDDLGEELVATVVGAPGVDLTVGALRAHAEQSLAYFEVPTRWLIRTEPLPTLPSGKVDKQALRRDHLDHGRA